MKDTFMAPWNADSISLHTAQLGGTPANPTGTEFLNNLKSYVYFQVN